MAAINDVVDLSNEGDLAIVTLDSPPVNALSPRLMDGIYRAFVKAIADPTAKAILLICAGRTFIAGADLKSLGSEEPEVDFFDLQARIENAGKPAVAAIHGTCLGGGLEVALTCNYRVAVPSARLGLPEVNLGLLPGGGGTQRLPRIVGVGAALDLLITGRQIGAAEALEVGLLDAVVVEGDLRDRAIAYAKGLIAEGASAKRVRDLDDQISRATPDAFATARERAARDRPGELAPQAIIRCVEAAAKGDFDAGIAVERDEFAILLEGAQSAALRHVFFAERQVAKVPGVPKETVAAGLDGLAICGDDNCIWIDLAGKSGLAPVVADASGADFSGRSVIVYVAAPNADVDRGRLTALRAGAPDAALIVDAPGTPLSSIVAGLDGAANVIGMHVDADGRLADIVRDATTSPEAVATALALAKKLGKVGIVTSGGDLAMGVRLIRAAQATVEAELAAGTDCQALASAASAFGFRADRLSAIRLPAGSASGTPAVVPDRLIFAVMAEAMAILEEGAASRSSDVDMAAMLAIGWPAYTGGPLYELQAPGFGPVTERMEALGLSAAALREKAMAG